MSDDLDDLKNLIEAATPAPDATKRAENIALAQKNFADLQGSRDVTRPTSEHPKRGLLSGVRRMFHHLTSRAGLTASSALVAVGIVAIIPLAQRDGSIPMVFPAPVSVESATDNLSRRSLPPIPAPATGQEAGLGQAAITASSEDQFAGALAPQSRLRKAAPIQDHVLGELIEEDALVLAPRFEQDFDAIAPSEPNTETFANDAPNPVKVTTETPVSTFSIDVDTASYAVIRNSLNAGRLPPANAVRIEEMVNYFPYDLPAPSDGAAFQPTMSVTQTPWNPDTQLLQIDLQGALPDVADRPPLNLVFLIDTSGSMNRPNKLPMLKQSFALMLGQLRPEDRIAIVAYAGSAGQVLAPTPASERSTILAALNNLSAGGSTAGQAGLQQAYATAAAMAEEGDVNRVILATDGDFNVGLSNPDALKRFIADQRDSGTYLSVLGFGRGNLDDATMQALAQNGNGTAAYIDTLAEAQKVLVDQLTGALFPIANDVKIQVEFNPSQISEYRLIGYETRSLRREDFNNDRVDAGDIGAGHQVTALYEITPTGSAAERNDPLRYGTNALTSDSDERAFLRLRYKTPGDRDSQLIETPIISTDSAPASFAAAIAGFGQLLQGSTYIGDWSYSDAIALANATKGDDPYGYRAEAIQLMRLAQSLSQ